MPYVDAWYEPNTVSHSIFGLNESTRVFLSGLYIIQGTESAGGNHLISVRLENFCQTSLSVGRGQKEAGIPSSWAETTEEQTFPMPTALQPEM